MTLKSENARTKQKQQTTGNRAIWLVYRADTNACGFWLIKRTPSGEKTSCPRTSRINRFFALTSYCNRLFNIRVFFGGKTNRPCFVPLADKTNNEHLPNHFSRSYENRYRICGFLGDITYQNDLTQVIFTRHRTNFDRLSICEFRCCVHTEPP